MASLEEDPREVAMDENVVVNVPAQWTASRGPSLDEDTKEAFTPWPATRGPSLDEFVETTPYSGVPDPRWQITEQSSKGEAMEANSFLMFPNLAAVVAPTVFPSMEQGAALAMPMQWPATQSPSLDEFMNAKSQAIVQDLSACDMSTTASSDEDGALKTPP